MSAQEPTKYMAPLVELLVTGKTKQFIKACKEERASSGSFHISDMYKGRTLLHYATKYNNKKAVTFLLNAGANPNARGDDDSTPFFIAAGTGYIEIIRLFIAACTNMDAPGICGATPLYMAVQNGHTKIAALLLGAGARADCMAEQATPFLIAVQYGRIELVQLFMDARFGRNVANWNGTTPLIMAAQKGYIDIVRLLLNDGSDIDAFDNDGMTPLLAAAATGRTNVVELLLKKGANPDICMLNGTTVLHATAQSGDIDTTELLLTAGVYPTAACFEKKTPYDLAMERGHTEIAGLLKQKETTLKESQNSKQRISLRTPWATAAFYEDIDSMQRLISNSAFLPSCHSRFNNKVDKLIDRNRFFRASGMLTMNNGNLVYPIAPIPRLIILAYVVLLQYGQSIRVPHVIMQWLTQWQKDMDALLEHPDYPLDDADKQIFKAFIHPEPAVTGAQHRIL